MGTPVASGWCTTSYEAKDQYEAWRQKLDAVYGSWTLSSPTKLGIQAEILQHSVGSLQLVNCICDPCGAVRKRADGRDGQDILAVQMVLSGREHFTIDSKNAVLGPGDILVWNTTRQARSSIPATSARTCLRSSSRPTSLPRGYSSGRCDPLVTTPEPARDLHLVVFGGHQIDERNRETPRFPSDREDRARALIREQLGRVTRAGTTTVVMASAAPGADIICHELCHELSINSTLCLPMPSDDYDRLVFGELDGWRSRYLALAASTNLK
jgi:hypothetical protein